MDLHTALNTDFNRTVLSPEDFPRNAPIRVTTFHHELGEMAFDAVAIGPASASHLRIRRDDGLIYSVPAGDCDLIEEQPR